MHIRWLHNTILGGRVTERSIRAAAAAAALSGGLSEKIEKARKCKM